MEVLQILAAAALLAGIFFFVAVEVSVTKARPTMVEQLLEDGAAGARSLKQASTTSTTTCRPASSASRSARSGWA